MPAWSSENVPLNGIFLPDRAGRHDAWRDSASGELLERVEDPALSKQLGVRVERATSMRPGTRYCLDGQEGCGIHFISGLDEDHEPPTRTKIREVRLELVVDPVGTGALTCPDIDLLILSLDASDERTSQTRLGFVAWVGETEHAVEQRVEADALLTYDDQRGQVTIPLGESVGRRRDGGGPFRVGPLCFAVAAFDRSGNLGPRSPAVCLNTQDTEDVNAVMVKGQACRCRALTRPARLPMRVVVALCLMLVGWWRSRRVYSGL